MLYLIRLVFGYVRIVIEGDNPEILINRIISEGITIWSVERKGIKIFLNISFKDYKRIRKIRSTLSERLRVRIIKKFGLPILIKQVLVRIGVVIGVLLVLLINAFMSNFIWMIEVNGANAINSKEILAACNDYNIQEGVFSQSIDTYNIAQSIAQKFDKIAWISINIEGSKLTVNISEATNSEDNTKPSNIVAVTDGVIESINYTSGTKSVQIGQTVRKGEVLISGVSAIGDKTKYVASSGTVIAHTQRTLTTKVNKLYRYRVCNDTTIHRKVLEVFNIKLPLYLKGVNSDYSSYSTSSKIKLFGKEIPIGTSSRCFIESNYIYKTLTESEAIDIAKSEIEEQLRKLNIEKITKQEIIVTSNDKYYSVVFSAQCLENIGINENIATLNYWNYRCFMIQ